MTLPRPTVSSHGVGEARALARFFMDHIRIHVFSFGLHPRPASRVPRKSPRLSQPCFPCLLGGCEACAVYLQSLAGLGTLVSTKHVRLGANSCTFHQPKAWQAKTRSPLATAEVWGFCRLHLPASPIWPRLRNLAWRSPGWCQRVWMLCPYSRVIGQPSASPPPASSTLGLLQQTLLPCAKLCVRWKRTYDMAYC